MTQFRATNGIKPKISRADIIQLSGAAVIALSGGSPKTALYDKIPMGRRDATGPAPISAVIQLPAATDTFAQQSCIFRECRARWKVVQRLYTLQG